MKNPFFPTWLCRRLSLSIHWRKTADSSHLFLSAVRKLGSPLLNTNAFVFMTVTMTSTTDVDQYVAKKLWFIFCTSLALANFLFFFETTYYKWNINCIIQLSDEEQFQLCVVRGYFIYFNTLFCSSLQSGVTSDAVNRPWHLLFEQIYVHMGQTCCKEYITTIDSWCQNNVTLYIFLSSSTSPPRHFFCMLTVILKIKAFLLLE